MAAPDLITLFRVLGQSIHHPLRDTTQLIAIPIDGYDSHRLARDASAAPILLIANQNSKGSGGKAPISLEHLSINHDVVCRIRRIDGETEEGIFTVVRCTSHDDELQHYFLRIVTVLLVSLGKSARPDAVTNAINALVELFRSLDRPQRKSVQGIWAELLLITQSLKPANLIEAWHATPDERYDFTIGKQHIEVKSSGNGLRQHYFSLNQLLPPLGNEVLIASIIVERSSSGNSIADLAKKISVKIRRRPELLLRLEQVVGLTLGERWRSIEEERFDFKAALESIIYYWVTEIPKVNPDLPVGVSDVKFKSDLSIISPAKNLSSQDGLFLFAHS